MIKKILNTAKNFIEKNNIDNFTKNTINTIVALLPSSIIKHMEHITNLFVLISAYMLVSLFMYPDLKFIVFIKEIFALICAYFAITLWFMDQTKKQFPIKTIIGVTACIAPVFFMNNNFSVALICVILLIICEFIIFEHIRGCHLFSNKTPAYIICETEEDINKNLLSDFKVLKYIVLSETNSVKFSSINSIDTLDRWLERINRFAFFPIPSRLIYLAKTPNADHQQQLLELSIKYSIKAFNAKIKSEEKDGKISQFLALTSLRNDTLFTGDKTQLATIFKNKKICICFDGHNCLFDLIVSFSAVQSINLTIVCWSEHIAVNLIQKLSVLHPEKSFNVKVVSFDNFIAQENKIDVLFYNMPINSSYCEESNQKEAIIGNVTQTQKLIQFAQQNHINDVFIFSSIKAFNANTWIGATQRLGELFAQFASTKFRKMASKFHVIRTPEYLTSSIEFFGDAIKQIKNNGHIIINNTAIPVLQNGREVYALIIKAINISMKNDDFLSSVLTVSTKKQYSIDDAISHVREQFELRPMDIRVSYSSEPRPMDLESFPNISETLEKTNIANVFVTRFINSGSELFEDKWDITEINRMSTRELVSAVMQSLNDKMKNQKKFVK